MFLEQEGFDLDKIKGIDPEEIALVVIRADITFDSLINFVRKGSLPILSISLSGNYKKDLRK